MPERGLIRATLALLAAVAMVVSAPIHAGHGHDASSPSATIHASCAICQVQAPVGTGIAEPVTAIEPGCAGRLIPADNPARPDDWNAVPAACRAPPRLLA
jgi:hypothetical protein